MPQDHAALTLGDEAPSFTLRTSEGEEARLDDVLRHLLFTEPRSWTGPTTT